MLILALQVNAYADDQSIIRINIKGYHDTVLLLTSYYGDKVILTDTATASKPGVFVFKNKEAVPGGIYMAVSPAKQKLFEFIIDTDQDFTMTTDTANYITRMVVKGSEENSVFFEYMNFNDQLYRANNSLTSKMGTVEKGSDEYFALSKQLDSLQSQASGYKLNIIEEYPELFVAKMFNAMRDVEVPDEVRNDPDSSAAYRYYKQHYWDYLDLSDPRLLRTPIMARKVDQYLSQLVIIHPDSAIAAVDDILAMAKPSNEVFSWLCWHFLSVYQNPEYMGFDKVFIYLIDEYFSKEEITNLTPSILQTLQDRADIMRPLLLGNDAPNLILIDSSGKYRSFMSLPNEYIVLFFWDIECGICKKEISELKTLYSERQFDLEIFAISVNADLEIWKKSLKEYELKWVNVNGTRSVTEDFHDLYDIHGTPAIYVLDGERKIIAKHLSADQVAGLLEIENRKK
jgi:hypothetical protein